MEEEEREFENILLQLEAHAEAIKRGKAARRRRGRETGAILVSLVLMISCLLRSYLVPVRVRRR